MVEFSLKEPFRFATFFGKIIAAKINDLTCPDLDIISHLNDGLRRAKPWGRFFGKRKIAFLGVV